MGQSEKEKKKKK